MSLVCNRGVRDPEMRFRRGLTEGHIPAHRPELGPCLIHCGADNGNGYAQFRYNGKNNYAHRYAWERVRGPIPSGMTVDHLCLIKRCCRETHLELVTGTENYLRWASQQMACRNGHNLLVVGWKVRANGRRRCCACDRAAQQRDSHSRKPAA